MRRRRGPGSAARARRMRVSRSRDPARTAVGVEPLGVVLEAQVEPAARLDDRGRAGSGRRRGTRAPVIRTRAGRVGGGRSRPGSSRTPRGCRRVRRRPRARRCRWISARPRCWWSSSRACSSWSRPSRPARVRRGAQRKRVGRVLMNRPTIGLDALDLGVAPGDRGAEHHVLPAGQPAEQQAPGALHDRAEGDPVLTGPRGEPGGDPLGQLHADLPGPYGRAASAGRADEPGRLVEPGERVDARPSRAASRSAAARRRR